MDKLWAPWRAAYITQILKKRKGCVFCTIFRQKMDRKNYVLLRSKHSYAVLNIYPYTNGHMLIIANRHVSEFEDLSNEERMDMLDLMLITKSLVKSVLKPQGYNVGVNLGKTAGAGFPGHLHIHLVPRWKGDVNFMPITANVKVLSQSLDILYQGLNRANKKRL